MNQPSPEVQQAQVKVLELTPEMREVARLMSIGVDYAEAAHQVEVHPELVLAWDEFHFGFQSRKQRLASVADDRLVSAQTVANALKLELEVERIEQAVATGAPVEVSKPTSVAIRARSPRPKTALELLYEAVAVEYDFQHRLANDINRIERDEALIIEPDRQKVMDELILRNAVMITAIEEETK